jgi:coenzyme F420 hydrogenase subunit beta
LANSEAFRGVKSVAVIGKPCDIAGLRRLQLAAPERLPKDIIFLSFLCAGTPAVEGTNSVVRSLGGDPEHLVEVRYRGNGWPGQFIARTLAGQVLDTSYEESWGQHLNRYLHDRCKLCVDGTGAYADVVAGDAWLADERGYPRFENSPGLSAILTRTHVGERLLLDAEADGAIAAVASMPAALSRQQPYQVERRIFAAYRGLGFRIAGRRTPSFPGFPRWRFGMKHPLLTARQAGGAWRRARRQVQSR